MLVAALAALINLLAARRMLAAARRFDSITLEGDARHLLTDVWTSAGMIAGLSCRSSCPRAGPSRPARRPGHGRQHRLHRPLPAPALGKRAHGPRPADAEIAHIEAAIRAHAGAGSRFHGLRTARPPGALRGLPPPVPGQTTVSATHDLFCAIEDQIRANCPESTAIHVEPLETSPLGRPAVWAAGTATAPGRTGPDPPFFSSRCLTETLSTVIL
jgi:hypothetical protein